MSFLVILQPEARRNFLELNESVRKRIAKTLAKLERPDLQFRHLKHGLPYFVEETRGYRVTFTESMTEKIRKVWFVGDHKEHEK